MTTPLRRALLLAAAALGAAACDAAPTQSPGRANAIAPPPASATGAPLQDRLEERLPVSRTIFVPCPTAAEGELVHVEGEALFRGHLVRSEGHQHLRFTADVSGTGVGLATGRVFEVRERARSVSNVREVAGEPGSGSIGWSERTRLIDVASGEHFVLELTGRVVLAGSSGLQLELLESTARCG